MKFNSLILRNFRNIERLTLKFDDGVNLIYGENGQGKTNLLEALWLTGGFKSFRRGKDNDFIKFGCCTADISAGFFSEDREQQIKLTYGKMKKTELNGVKCKSNAEIIGKAQSVVFSPDYISLVKGAPADRRKFCDIALCQAQPGYAQELARYNKVLNQRNTALKNIKYGIHSEREMLKIWDAQLIELNSRIVTKRLRYIKALREKVQRIYSGLSSDREQIDIRYAIKTNDRDMLLDDMAIKAVYEDLFEKSERDDIKNGSTSIGAHRDDILIDINEKSAKSFASQGQQRSAAIAFKLAEAEMTESVTGEYPVILLDDVMSELDVNRQDYILNHIKNRQVFITCCEPSSVMRMCSGNRIYIENGTVREDG